MSSRRRCDALRRSPDGAVDQRPPEDGGPARPSLEAKIFGGAKTIAQLFECRRTECVLFAMQFLKDEGIPVVGESRPAASIGRKLEFWPLERPCPPVSADRRRDAEDRCPGTASGSCIEASRKHDRILLGLVVPRACAAHRPEGSTGVRVQVVRSGKIRTELLSA